MEAGDKRPKYLTLGRWMKALRGAAKLTQG